MKKNIYLIPATGFVCFCGERLQQTVTGSHTDDDDPSQSSSGFAPGRGMRL
jgi:hypothetical protein